MIIPEIGWNFLGDLNLAKDMIKSAKENGAEIIEKHFTISRDLDGRDNKFAILPDELKKIKEFSIRAKEMNSNLGLDLQDDEVEVFNSYRGRWKASKI
jgi:sialic acid synthase SpsE